ncbi:DUF3152 domain-containing protein [Streptomyces sp. NPDC047002]|uniref:DUF3152 domain-containing protein n=1 Tax=Streptomyces sp. NPDC047002 TaxID=3155475 RepID=UPI0034534741
MPQARGAHPDAQGAQDRQRYGGRAARADVAGGRTLRATAPPTGRETAPAPGEPGPRPEYLAAFDGPPKAPGPAAAPGAGAPRGRRGRALGGAAAAAVVTVLALVVAGQFLGRPGARSVAAGDGAGQAGAARPAATASARVRAAHAPVPPYDQLMARAFPLSADLKGTGRFTAVPGSDPAPGTGRHYRYRVDIEDGLPLDGRLFAEAVQKTLNDDRSWAHHGEKTFERVSTGRPDFVITLASPGTTDVWCAKSGLDTSEERVSCDSAATERVMINAYRWARGARTYGPGAMHAYRQMLINHEVGHRLGHDHVDCAKPGALAPVMQQQTKSLDIGGIRCRANPWPYPRG